MTPTAQPWMGGDPDGHWANHYELLGLPVGCADTETIGRIADELLKRIEDESSHNDAQQLKALKDSVLDAKACLMDGVTKTAYDQQLAGIHPSSEPASAGEIPAAIPVATPVPTISSPAVPFQTHRRSRSNLRQRRRSGFWFTLGSVLFGVGLFAGLAFLAKRYFVDKPPTVIATPGETQTNTAVSPTARPPSADKNQPKFAAHDTTDSEAETAVPGSIPRGLDDSATTESPPADTSTSVDVGESSSPVVETPKPLSQQELDQLSKTLNAVLPALGRQRFGQANDTIEAARQLARHPGHVRLVDQLAELVHYTQEYWSGLDDAWDDLQAGEELVVGNSRVNIVEINQERLTLRVAGTNRRYQRSAISAGLQQAIIDRWLDEDTASTHLIRGAYYATKTAPDWEKARRAWQQAEARGAEIDRLLPVLNASYDVEHLRQLESEP